MLLEPTCSRRATRPTSACRSRRLPFACLSNGERADVRTAAIRFLPRFIEVCAGEAVFDGDGCRDFGIFRQRRIISAFIAACLVMRGVDAPCLESDDVACRQGGASAAVAFPDGQVNGRLIYGDNVSQQVSALLLD